MSQATLLDIAKLNGNDAVVGLIEENLTYAPELSVFPARTIKGTQYKTVIRDGLATTGFRNANEGQAPTKSSYRNALVECQIFGGNVIVDKAVAAAHEDGAEAFKALEADGVMKSALISLGKQVWYGTSNDSKGFPGLQAFVDSSMTIDAGGTTAGTGSSVYAVCLGPKLVQMIFGQGLAFAMSSWADQLMAGATAGTYYAAEVASLTAWAGLQAVDKYSVARLKDATADTGKGVTDAQLAALLALFPVGYTPSAFFMSRRSRSQLQASRSVVLNSTGSSKITSSTEAVAPLPTEAFGIPIIATDCLLNTETLS